MDKALKGKKAVELIHDRLGGSMFVLRDATSTRQEMTRWAVQGVPAHKIIQKLTPFSRLKRHQCALVNKVVPGKYPVTVEKDGTLVKMASRTELARLLGVSIRSVNSYFRQNGDAFEKNGYTINKMMQNNRVLGRAIRDSRLQHSKITSSLHPAYTAGFFDAEGNVSLGSRNAVVTIKQKHAVIIDALQLQYGGSKGRDSSCWRWRVCGHSSRVFLTIIAPFVYEKRDQVLLCLQANDDNWRKKEAELKQLRGGVKK